MKRAIAMSGSAFTAFAHYFPNNHIAFYKKVFELDPKATAEDVLKFMRTASVDVILRKTPVIAPVIEKRNLLYKYFAAVIEGLFIIQMTTDGFLIIF